MLSQAVRSAWAKHRRDDDESLSLVRHCEDAAAIAGHLWDDWLPTSTREFLAIGRSRDEARTLACWLAGVHDIGKLSPAFAIQVYPLALRMDDAGLRVPMTVPRRQDTPHSLASYNAVLSYLTKREWPGRVASTYAVVAGGHHGVPPTSSQLARFPDRSHYGGAEWRAARDELLDHISRIVGAEPFIAEGWKRPLTPQQQALWTGFVIMADWIASSDLFPLGIRDESVSTAACAWSALELPPPWRAAPPPSLDDLMRVRFRLPAGAAPNLVQRTVVTAASLMQEPGMLIIEAPMGIGKTEAALAASEHLAARFGQGGVFMALPTMATSNAMFARVLHWLGAQGTTEDASVVLAHGKASLEDAYCGLLRQRALVDVGRDAGVGNDKGEVIAHYWLSGRKKGMLADFAVGTIDQLLFGGLKAKHLALRHLALVNKVVIVDEVHAADFYMSQYLIRILEWLGSYRVPVILMSATLPAIQRISLARAYEAGRGWTGDDSVLRGNIGYPAITVIDGSRHVESAADFRPPTQVAVERIDDSMDSLIDRLRVLLAAGGCVGIVRNTVARAQHTARTLSVLFPGDVVLLHSRFVARHRADLESGLVAELGPAGTRPAGRPRIVVGTQVIEQSLDVDFDLLVSDVAPIDLLFQRIGRLHRHDRIRPPNFAQPRVILTGVEDWAAEPPSAVKASRRIYGDFNLLRTFAVLAAREHVGLPDDIASLVQSAYSDDLEFPASWVDRAVDARRAHQQRQMELANAAGKWRIWEPRRSPTLRDWLAEGVGEVDDARGQAKVRDTDDGIDVLLTVRVGDVVRLLPQCGGEVISTDFRPDDYLARRALTGSVRLPLSLAHPGIAGATIGALEQRMYPGWQESKWLAGELVLELDSELSAQLLDYDIRYDAIEGLIVTTLGDQS